MGEQGHDAPLRAEMGRLEDRITQLERELADTRVEVAQLKGSLGVLQGAYDRAANVVASQAIADAEVRRSTATRAVVRDQAEERKRDRAAWRKLATAVAALIAALATAVATGKC